MGAAPEYLKKYVTKRGDTHMYNLRNDNNLNIPLVFKARTQNSFINKAFNMYNNLPNDIKNENKLEKFTKLLVKWIKSNIKL